MTIVRVVSSNKSLTSVIDRIPQVGDLARLAYCNDIVVGAVCCRVDKTEMGQRRLYIMTLGCLAPYRRLGIGTKLLKHVLEYAKKDGNFNSIYL